MNIKILCPPVSKGKVRRLSFVIMFVRHPELADTVRGISFRICLLLILHSQHQFSPIRCYMRPGGGGIEKPR
jgi:hypothetical protein